MLYDQEDRLQSAYFIRFMNIVENCLDFMLFLILLLFDLAYGRNHVRFCDLLLLESAHDAFEVDQAFGLIFLRDLAAVLGFEFFSHLF